jgi:transmembrane sensor
MLDPPLPFHAMMSVTMHRVVRLSWVCLCVLIASSAGGPGSTPAAAWKTYETPVGASQQITLPDGSFVHLNTSTRLRIYIAGIRRAVTVERGEAFFRVVGNPLPVIVGDWVINAADASFSVRDDGDGAVDVMALDRPVRIDSAPDNPSGSVPRAPRVVQVVSAGQVAQVRTGKVSLYTEGRETIERKLMWRYGMLEFVGEKIENITAEFNRYGHTKLVVDGDATRDLRLGGRFSVLDPDTFMATASRVFDLRIETYQTDRGAVVHLGQMSKSAGTNASPTRRKIIQRSLGVR